MSQLRLQRANGPLRRVPRRTHDAPGPKRKYTPSPSTFRALRQTQTGGRLQRVRTICPTCSREFNHASRQTSGAGTPITMGGSVDVSCCAKAVQRLEIVADRRKLPTQRVEFGRCSRRHTAAQVANSLSQIVQDGLIGSGLVHMCLMLRVVHRLARWQHRVPREPLVRDAVQNNLHVLQLRRPQT